MCITYYFVNLKKLFVQLKTSKIQLNACNPQFVILHAKNLKDHTRKDPSLKDPLSDAFKYVYTARRDCVLF